ncbi:MAG: hypothetical protein J5994_08675 [Ruminococcus sp.]|nr:hypothetical protein [Ruminococcus sp.]
MSGRIRQPRNAEIKAKKAEVDLVWKQTFGKEQSDRFSSIQKFIDSECIRLMRPYTPARNEILSKGAVLGTKIGSGEIHYVIPYARYQYYGKLMVSGVTGSSYARHGESKTLTDRNLNYSKFRHPKAQKMWFETMKADHKEHILRGAAAIARRK